MVVVVVGKSSSRWALSYSILSAVVIPFRGSIPLFGRPVAVLEVVELGLWDRADGSSDDEVVVVVVDDDVDDGCCC